MQDWRLREIELLECRYYWRPQCSLWSPGFRGHNTLQNHSEGFGRTFEFLAHCPLYAITMIGKTEFGG